MSHKHVYAIPAYGDSPYLESCIKSLKEQKVASPVILCTSTPSPFLADMAEKYDILILQAFGYYFNSLKILNFLL